MKGIRLIFAGLIVVSLFSCDAFLAPLQGRWNLSDPKNELTAVELSTTVDGYVENPSITDFAGANLSVSDMRKTLLKFDLSTIPAVVVYAELQLYMNVGGTFPAVVNVILQSWDPTTVNWSQVNSSGFYNTTHSPAVQVGPAFVWYYFDITNIIQYISQSSIQGFLVSQESYMPAMSATFNSREAGINVPKLVVYGYSTR